MQRACKHCKILLSCTAKGIGHHRGYKTPIRRAECKTFIEKIKIHTEVLNKVLQASQDIWIRIRSSVRSSDYDSLYGEDLSKALRTAMKLEELMAIEPSVLHTESSILNYTTAA